MGRLGYLLLYNQEWYADLKLKKHNLKPFRDKNLVVFLNDFWMTQLYIRN